MYEKCLFFNLNTFTREINKRWEEEFAKLGLSASHGYFLRLVLAAPNSTQKDLAERLNLAPSTLTRFVDALEKKGLLKREASAEDARAITIAPTKKAVALETELDATIDRLTNYLTEIIGPRNSSDLVKIIQTYQEKICAGGSCEE